MRFFAPNLETRGRLVRGMGGLAFLVAGLVVIREKPWLGIPLLFCAGFVLFEAVRGWCILRACGIKTRF